MPPSCIPPNRAAGWMPRDGTWWYASPGFPLVLQRARHDAVVQIDGLLTPLRAAGLVLRLLEPQLSLLVQGRGLRPGFPFHREAEVELAGARRTPDLPDGNSGAAPLMPKPLTRAVFRRPTAYWRHRESTQSLQTCLDSALLHVLRQQQRWAEFSDEWWSMYSAARDAKAGQGVHESQRLYRWTAEMPIRLETWVATGPEGEDVVVPDPVAFAEFMTSSNWHAVEARDGMLAAGPFEEDCNETGNPGQCTAMLYLNPPPETRLQFVCSEGTNCSPLLSCQSSSSGGGFCNCAAASPPTQRPSYCDGQFTWDGGAWVIDCDGTCGQDETCTYVCYVDNGILWYWCDCV